MKPVAFVIPWYGLGIPGGAETECYDLAHCIKDEGIPVEVLTTCVRKASDDRGVNTLKSGVNIEEGIIVRRFNVRVRNDSLYNAAHYKLLNGLSVTMKDEMDYANNDINSDSLYKFIQDNQENYTCFIFMPYLYGLIYNGYKSCLKKCIMIPCLHDEVYAHMEITKKALESMKGIIFLSKPESILANSIANLQKVPCEVLGAYVKSGWDNNVNPHRFRKKYNIFDDFILYAGRKDAGKKADELRDFFIRMKKNSKFDKLKLVFIGSGKINIDAEYQDSIIDLGFVPIEDKYDAMAAATMLCNPSRFESFSIVIMESWLAKRPVIVSEFCKVTKNFCIESNAGLFYSCYEEFAEEIEFMLDRPELMDLMGENGFRYVKENFTHEIIGKKYINFIKRIFE